MIGGSGGRPRTLVDVAVTSLRGCSVPLRKPNRKNAKEKADGGSDVAAVAGAEAVRAPPENGKSEEVAADDWKSVYVT
jgi:hypothetical protein